MIAAALLAPTSCKKRRRALIAAKDGPLHGRFYGTIQIIF
jgi:hypothetical protein